MVMKRLSTKVLFINHLLKMLIALKSNLTTLEVGWW
jgi:hypothetical protein